VGQCPSEFIVRSVSTNSKGAAFAVYIKPRVQYAGERDMSPTMA
jgi:hypothetical protein